MGVTVTAAIGLILAALTLPPVEATRAACLIEHVSADRCGEALAILRVESRGVAVGVHRGHAPRKPGGVFWRRAVDRGLLHPERCSAHQSTDRGDGWGIRGPHGLAAAYSVYLLGECVAPEAIDVPLLSALVTLRRLRALERRHGLRTPEARALAWRVGVGAARRSQA